MRDYHEGSGFVEDSTWLASIANHSSALASRLCDHPSLGLHVRTFG